MEFFHRAFRPKDFEMCVEWMNRQRDNKTMMIPGDLGLMSYNSKMFDLDMVEIYNYMYVNDRKDGENITLHDWMVYERENGDDIYYDQIKHRSSDEVVELEINGVRLHYFVGERSIVSRLFKLFEGI